MRSLCAWAVLVKGTAELQSAAPPLASVRSQNRVKRGSRYLERPGFMGPHGLSSAPQSI